MKLRGGLLAGGVLVAAACGYPGIEGEGPAPGPAYRGSGRADAASGDDGAPAPPPPPQSDAGDGGGPPPEGGAASTLCLAADLVLCYAFDGTLVDRSPNALVPTTAQAAGFVAGRQGQAVLLDAQSAIRFSPNAAFEMSAGTIEAFVKRAAGSTEPTSVVFDDDERFSVTIELGGAVLCKSSGGSAQAGSVPVDVWTHVACTCDGATLRIYTDGVERGSGAGSIASRPAAAAALGGNSPSGEPFLGALDSLRVFRVARTPAQIAAAAAGL